MNNKVSKKNIWIFHHYATPPTMSGLTRPYDLAKNIITKQYNCTIFSSSFLHYSGENIINDSSRYKQIVENSVPFVFVKTSGYKKSKLLRVKNMIDFYMSLMRIEKEYSKLNGKPDAIIGSSAHPLAALAAIVLAKKYKCNSIVEVRDLWPESFLAYDIIKKNNPLVQLLYAGERWIYKNADRLIFTMEGGREYIIGKGWNRENGGPIDLNKVYHINNGVDLEVYDYNKENCIFKDEDIEDKKTFKIIYAGSIRKANNLELIINAAKYIKENSNINAKFIIYGDGSERENLENKCKSQSISNVIFKGKIEKKYIPYILSKSNLNILNYSYHNIWKYGGSQNKNFEYLASGRPILSTISMGYDIIKKYGAGISLSDQSAESIGKAIIEIANMDEKEYVNMSNNARRAAEDYDFTILTKKLIEIIEGL